MPIYKKILVLGFVAVSVLGASSLAHADEVISSKSHTIRSSLDTSLVSVKAKCRSPKFEDDSCTAYFSDSSYKFLRPYFDRGFDFKLVNKTCGGPDGSTKPELSGETFEAVTVLLFNVWPVQQDLEKQIRSATEI